MGIAVRHRAGAALLRFAVERSLERQEMERRLNAMARPDSTANAGAMATLAAARCFESAMLWVGWRLQPQQLTLSEIDRLSS